MTMFASHPAVQGAGKDVEQRVPLVYHPKQDPRTGGT